MPIFSNSRRLKFGVVGSEGIQGLRLLNYLDTFGEVVWSCNSNDAVDTAPMLDWVLISSPNIFHYEYARHFINLGVHVFLEKPPTLSVEAFTELVELASKRQVHVYVNDVFLFRTDIDFTKSSKQKAILRWAKTDGKAGAILDRLAYHHLYCLHRAIQGDEDIANIKVKIKNIAHLDFSFEYCGMSIDASYQSTAPVSENIFLNSVIFPTAGQALKDMFSYVFSAGCDYAQNNARALWSMRQLAQLKKRLQPRVAVVGAGLFGCTAALEASAAGYTVDLFERHDDIVQEASAINQYRVHRGYHYPRSDETVTECLTALPLFLKNYGQAVMRDSEKGSFYAISIERSKTTAADYIRFLDRHGLEYTEVDSLPNTTLTVRVTEDLFDPIKIQEIVKTRLYGSGVGIKIGVRATPEMICGYDSAIVATYAGQNQFAQKPSLYQFELIEKPILQLPERYRGQSVVVLDGPFMCIDPYSDTPYHVMGNVVHAIHHTNTGYAPQIPEGYEQVLNKGVIQNPAMSKIKDFLQSAEEFFPEIDKAVHIGSMFTIRTVLPYRDDDDARPTLVDWLAPKVIGIFAGKICHCVAAGRTATALLNEEYS